MADFALQQSPGHLLRRAQQYADDLYKKEVGATGPTPRQFTVLHTVSMEEGLSQTDLVRRTGIDRSTLADMIARLTKKGYLARQRTKDDARANAVKLTAQGRKIMKSAETKVMKAEEDALAMLPKTQQSSFMKNLRAYAEALDKIEAEMMAPKRQPAAKKAAKTTKKTTAKKARTKKGAAATQTATTATETSAAASAAPAKKARTKKAPAKKTAAKKAPAKKTTKAAAKKAPAKKAPAKKGATKQATARKVARKTPRKKATPAATA
ncbi:MarR family winged helix-turn-helix transcriptional regulator [Parvularcula dongshanensis]|uniref:DNA-binding MarR family transcriptional regulator n=1 Tax=Parvularcula dongshanensis TaxID=1173995 RepID=A0A840I1C2_9PROT|nr:MarR family transcriptional regulator [Parvularcula dongshanensis]MBB4658081.1 DNA-binding MarR family transcriptional regulator [Parvularcula dongshanensis]